MFVENSGYFRQQTEAVQKSTIFAIAFYWHPVTFLFLLSSSQSLSLRLLSSVFSLYIHTDQWFFFCYCREISYCFRCLVTSKLVYLSIPVEATADWNDVTRPYSNRQSSQHFNFQQYYHLAKKQFWTSEINFIGSIVITFWAQ